MNRTLLKSFVPCFAGVLSLSAMTMAQTAPPPSPPGDHKQDGDDRRDGPPMRDGERGGPGGDERRGPGGPDDRGPGGNDRGPGGDRNQRPPRPDQDGKQNVPPEMARFQGYLTMVGQYRKLASDPEASGVAAVVSAADILRKGGPQEAINYFTKVLPDVKQDAVRRAIRLQLIDLYKAANQPDKALEQLNVLITADNSPASASESPKK